MSPVLPAPRSDPGPARRRARAPPPPLPPCPPGADSAAAARARSGRGSRSPLSVRLPPGPGSAAAGTAQVGGCAPGSLAAGLLGPPAPCARERGRRRGRGREEQGGRRSGFINLDTNLNRYCPLPGQDASEGATTPLICPNMGMGQPPGPSFSLSFSKTLVFAPVSVLLHLFLL